MFQRPNELSSSTADMMSSPSSTAYDAERYFGTTGSPLFHQVTEGGIL